MNNFVLGDTFREGRDPFDARDHRPHSSAGDVWHSMAQPDPLYRTDHADASMASAQVSDNECFRCGSQQLPLWKINGGIPHVLCNGCALASQASQSQSGFAASPPQLLGSQTVPCSISSIMYTRPQDRTILSFLRQKRTAAEAQHPASPSPALPGSSSRDYDEPRGGIQRRRGRMAEHLSSSASSGTPAQTVRLNVSVSDAAFLMSLLESIQKQKTESSNPQ